MQDTTGAPYIGNLSMDDLQFSKMYMQDNKFKVDISLKGSKFEFNLCSDFQKAYQTRFSLDGLRDDSDNSRRGQVIMLQEPKTVEVLKALDERIMDMAVKNGAEWFKSKTPLSEQTIRDRYQRVVFKIKEEDDAECMKFKVKMDNSKVPTKLHLSNHTEEGCNIEEDRGRVQDLERRGCKIAPVLTSVSLWFIGGKDPAKYGISFQAEELILVPAEAKPLARFYSKLPYKVSTSRDGDSTMASRRDRPSEDEPLRAGDLEGDAM